MLGVIVGVIGSIMGTLLGVSLGYYFSKKIAETQAKHAEKLAIMNARIIAGAKLRAAFAPEIAKYNLILRDSERKTGGAVEKLLKDALPKHAAAIEEYRPFVLPRRKEDYNEAWEDYQTPIIEIDISRQFMAYEDDPEFFKERIEAILKFTEPL